MADADPRATTGRPLHDRVVAVVAHRGIVGITREELLRKLGVGPGELMAALDQLREERLVRVHWPSAETFRVFYTG